MAKSPRPSRAQVRGAAPTSLVTPESVRGLGPQPSDAQATPTRLVGGYEYVEGPDDGPDGPLQMPTPDAIANLVPQHAGGFKLNHDTIVVCLHRGGPPVRDKFDSIDYEIQPGYFQARYDAARHFQARAVVPGSRDPFSGKQSSFIGILYGLHDPTKKLIDREDRCRPFTQEQLERFALIPEAIDRAALGLGGSAKVIPVAAVRARTLASGRGDIDQAAQVRERQPQVPAESNEALRQMAADAAGARAPQAAEPDEA